MTLLINKAVSQLLLPPGLLIVLAVVGLMGWKRRWGRGLIAFSMLTLWFLSIEPVRDVLLSPLENRYPAFQTQSFEAIKNKSPVIVLLGSGIEEKAPEYGGHDALSRNTLMRTVYAADLAHRTGLDIYATGGAVLSETTEPEGILMQRMLVHLGIAESSIHVETKANNTWENAANLQHMLKSGGKQTIVLVTTAWHMPRSVRVFEQQGFDVVAAPCDYVVKRSAYDIRSWLPHWDVMADSADGLHEYMGMLWYWFRYG